MSNNTDSHPDLISPGEIKPANLELETVRKKLAGSTGPRYWRTLQELADSRPLVNFCSASFLVGLASGLIRFPDADF
jgi:hypothetical protein